MKSGTDEECLNSSEFETCIFEWHTNDACQYLLKKKLFYEL